ncbi:enoyl-CoA hydratase-related protein [Streptomyces sp. RGM 3693]|uniref:enoyl-CoA hydratase-related protein n=1 Tax=Streptomyces sp. RGM 3693 TaxID=3413284 RepID=UPI003D287177
MWEEAIGLNRARHLALAQGSFAAEQAHQWGAIAEVVPPDRALPRAHEIAESLDAQPQLLPRHFATTLRQRISRRLAEGLQRGSALKGLTAADLAHQQRT